ncbi:hypothetical protein [Wenyingzhuangia marina]|uniref:YceI-like domain-containing protein n=1 Tax=Wenyingzhuangia marina TaxID=1195760 RepID=A0A1M5ULL6_9FLAO|nr:hypothetical protein [Wenyingzhuangia marina]GGF66946.1 hypothetical protein GCM10011397_07590 [Wenyingzhuangia marina]SHH63879.1 hypothetical protein SAMN05444281_1341 [Wenyingzhuangia marina]
MKKIVIIFTIFTFLSFNNKNINQTTLGVLPESEIIVSGKSNVNSFDCKYKIQDLSKPITVSFKQTKDDENKDQLEFTNAKFYLKNKCFDCGNNFINKDFNKMLRTEEYPKILIELLSVCVAEDGCSALANMGVNIAGIHHEYLVPIRFYYENNIYEVGGVINVNLDDFKIQSPKKVLGLIKVDNHVKVNLDLKLKELKP